MLEANGPAGFVDALLIGAFVAAGAVASWLLISPELTGGAEHQAPSAGAATAAPPDGSGGRGHCSPRLPQIPA